MSNPKGYVPLTALYENAPHRFYVYRGGRQNVALCRYNDNWRVFLAYLVGDTEQLVISEVQAEVPRLQEARRIANKLRKFDDMLARQPEGALP